MRKYIDAEHIRRWILARWEEKDATNPYPLSGREILDQIEREEYFAADVVAVVRCKDCKYRDEGKGFCEGRGWPMQLVPDDGFCDKGERGR